jgi:hypothetical protein
MTYKIDFTDPLHGEFVVFPKTTNAPPAATAKTALNVYGKGSLNWGEGVNENFLHLLEKFAGATPPANPLIGQLWFCIRYYKHNIGTPDTWWRYNLATDSWDPLTVGTTQPPSPSIGDYWFDVSTGKLFRWDRLTQAQDENNNYLQPPTWNQRYYLTFADNLDTPPAGDPAKSMYVWNGLDWTVTASILAQGLPPPDAVTGTLWYDTTNKRLFMWDSGLSQWIALFLTTATSPMEGNFDANTNKIVGVADPIIDSDGANLKYLVATTSIATTNLTEPFVEHINDNSRHLDPWQNEWIDVVSAVPTGVTSDEVNRLAGLNFNLQQRIDQLANSQTSLISTKVNKSGDIMTGPLKVAAYNGAISSPTQQAIQKQYFDTNWKLKELLDVDGPAVGDGDVLKWSTATQKWVPVKVTNSLTIDIVSSTQELSAGGTAVQLRGYVVNSGGTKTDITTVATWSIISDPAYVTMTGTAPKSLTSPLNTPIGQVAKVRLLYNDGATTKSVVRSFSIAAVTGIIVAGPTLIRHNQAVSYTASATLSNATTRNNIESSCAWEFPIGTSTSSSFTVPTSVPVGSNTVKATYTGSGYSRTLSVNVQPGVVSLAISGATTVYEGGFTTNFAATLTLTTGNVNVTNSSAWSIVSGPGTIGATTGIYTSPTSVVGNTPVQIRCTNTGYGSTISNTYDLTIVDRPPAGFTEYTSPGAYTFNVPATYTQIRINMTAGGGGGQGGDDYGSGAGGSGGYYQNYIMGVTPGTALTVIVGGGAPGTAGGYLSHGGNSSVAGLIATGGQTPVNNHPSSVFGYGGSPNGQNGTGGFVIPSGPFAGENSGGTGGSNPFGTGGAGGIGGAPHQDGNNGLPGTGYGAGGGGGGNNRVGGNGANGYVKIEWGF